MEANEALVNLLIVAENLICKCNSQQAGLRLSLFLLILLWLVLDSAVHI